MLFSGSTLTGYAVEGKDGLVGKVDDSLFDDQGRRDTGANGRRLGILGLGRVGRAIARRAEGFGMTIAYTDLRAAPDVAYRFHAALVDLAGVSDFLVVSAAGGRGSRGIVDAAVLDALGPEGVLVNVARGSVVANRRWLRRWSRAGWAAPAWTSSPTNPRCRRRCGRWRTAC